LGAKEGIIEALIGQIKEIPFIAKDMQIIVKKLSEGTLSIELSKAQIEWLSKELKSNVKPTLISFGLILAGFFVLFYDASLKNIALLLFGFGFLRLIYK